MRRIMLPATLFLCISFWVPAEAAGPKEESSHVTVEENRAAGILHKLKADFRDSTVGQAFSLIAEALDGSVNLVVHSSAKEIQIPDFSVRYANVLMITNLIHNLIPDLETTISAGGEFQDVEDIMEYCPTDEDLLSNYLESLEPNDVPTILINLRDWEDIPVSCDFRVYAVSDILSDRSFTIHDIATAVETAWQMFPNTYAASLKFHEETGLLICTGTEQHLNIIDQVIMVMEGDDKYISLNSQMKQLKEKNESLEEELFKMRCQNKDLHEECRALRRTLEALQEKDKKKK